MARVKDWMIDMEDYTWQAIQRGMSLSETIVFVKKNLKSADESYIRRIYNSNLT